MACPQTENKFVGVRFLMHGMTNHILLKQRGSGLAKPNSTLSISAFYSHNLMLLPKVIKRISLSMRLNPQVCFEGAQIGGLFFDKISKPKKGVWCNLRD
jgi:hypothetical protein